MSGEKVQEKKGNPLKRIIQKLVRSTKLWQTINTMSERLHNVELQTGNLQGQVTGATGGWESLAARMDSDDNTTTLLAKTQEHIQKELAEVKAELLDIRVLNAEMKNFMMRSQKDYNQWIVQNEPNEKDLKEQRGHQFEYRPEFCLILTVSAMDPDRMDAVVCSLITQTYSFWHLYIITYDVEIEKKINEYHKQDKRITHLKIDDPEKVLNIFEAATQQIQGDYFSFMDINDTLAPFALFEAAKVLNENPEVGFIYADEDKISDSKRYDPVYKPDFAPDTLRSTNYIGTFYFIKSSLLSRVFLRMEYIGDMHYEIILHACEITGYLYHIRKILNHRCGVRGRSIIDYITESDSTLEIIKSHITRQTGLNSTVTQTEIENIYRVDYELTGNPMVSILIPNKDHTELLKPCIESILKLTTYDNYEIVIIENNSADDETFVYYKEVEKDNRIRVIYYPETEFNYHKIINYGVKNNTGDYILQLNNDIQLITPNWLEIMLGYAQRSDVGAVGARLYYPDKSIQHAGGVFTQDVSVTDHIFRFMPEYAHGYMNRESTIQNMSWVTGACMLSRKEIYEQVGFMTEDFRVSSGDSDFCMKIKEAGKTVIYNPFVELYHYEGKTRGRCDTPDELAEFISEREMFLNKWHDDLVYGDPFYAPGMDKVVFHNDDGIELTAINIEEEING